MPLNTGTRVKVPPRTWHARPLKPPKTSAKSSPISTPNNLGANSFAAQLAGTILGGTETTLYVLAVYFGSVAIRRGRHALAAGLLADAAGVAASLVICRLVFR